MRLPTHCRFGICLIGLLVADETRGQTDLHRFQRPPGVVTFQSAHPYPTVAQPAPPAIVTRPPTAAYYAPVVQAQAAPIMAYVPVIAAPVIAAPVSIAPAIEAPITPITANYVPPAMVTPLATPAIVATEWTPVDAGSAVTSYSPVVTSGWRPVTPNGSSRTTYYAPGTTSAPVVIYPSTALPTSTSVGVTAYRPTVTYLPVVTPVTTAVPATTTAVGRQVIVRPKVYIQGQPLRNFFRAITP